MANIAWLGMGGMGVPLAEHLRLTQECLDGLGMPAPVITAAKQMLDAMNAQGHGQKAPSWPVLQTEKMVGLDPAELKGEYSTLIA